MTSVSTVVLVDTNVLVYAYDPTDGAKRQRATLVLDQLGRQRRGAISTQIMGEFFVTATRKIPSPLSPGDAERRLVNYRRSWTIFNLTPSIVLEAVAGLQRHSISYWDALIWATAKLNQVQDVLTEDLQHGLLLEGVRFQNPFATDFDLAQIQIR
jgi:predicted nucleic acid-binding protein